MKQNLTQKLICKHLIEGTAEPGEPIQLKIDQTLTQDALGTMAYLEFEAIGVPRVKTELSVCYVDHNTLQLGYENSDDHRYLQTISEKFGLYYSRPGNGICHQVHLERFGKPGKSLLGSDSHTPTGGGLGMLAIGAGGMDVAMAMAGHPFHLVMPLVVQVDLHGKLKPWVSAKDIALELLRRVTVKGGVGKIFEYTGNGTAALSVTQRATIANMGAETGATSSVFPSDCQTQAFLRAQGRINDFVELSADADAVYSDQIIIDLSSLEALVAKPHLPDNVIPVKELFGMPIDQVFIGSCTNSSYADLVAVAKILKGKTISPKVSLSIAPGSKQTLVMLAKEGFLADIIASGARILECTCGPCTGSGGAPPTKGVSLRTINRNFEGRCGTLSAGVYLSGAETCAASAIAGYLTDAQQFCSKTPIELPAEFDTSDNMIIPPSENGIAVEIQRGPNIKPLPRFEDLPDSISTSIILKTGDHVTTDHIIPADARVIQLRSNIPALSKFSFSKVDPTFYDRIIQSGGGVISGGVNYGQGSSREHAVIAPKHLGVKAVIAKSFARIHQQNLINFGILPLLFINDQDYDFCTQGDQVSLLNLRESLERNSLSLKNETQNKTIKLNHTLTERQIKILLSGGVLRYLGK